jgi:hypothetical protein
VPAAGKTDKENAISLSAGSRDVKFKAALDGKLLNEFMTIAVAPRPFEHMSI